MWFFNQNEAFYQPRLMDVVAFTSTPDAANDSSLVALIKTAALEKQVVVIAQAKPKKSKASTAPVVAELAVVTPVDSTIESVVPQLEISKKSTEPKTVVEINIPSLANQLKSPSRSNRKGLDNAAKGEVAQSAAAAKFNLLDYSLAQLNNVVHGSKVEPPKNTKELLPEPIDLAFNRVSALFKNNKNN
jgi:hypothetical protein